MKNNKRYTYLSGITLIALVITIIVLLIIAGISISMLTGENSLLKKAAEAKELTDLKQLEEQDKILDYEVKIENTFINTPEEVWYKYDGTTLYLNKKTYI